MFHYLEAVRDKRHLFHPKIFVVLWKPVRVKKLKQHSESTRAHALEHYVLPRCIFAALPHAMHPEHAVEILVPVGGIYFEHTCTILANVSALPVVLLKKHREQVKEHLAASTHRCAWKRCPPTAKVTSARSALSINLL